MVRITDISALPGYRLEITFTDGKRGIVDLSALVGRGVFASWKDATFFARVSVDPLTRTATWPGGIDLDPDVLYAKATGQAVESIEAA